MNCFLFTGIASPHSSLTFPYSKEPTYIKTNLSAWGGELVPALRLTLTNGIWNIEWH